MITQHGIYADMSEVEYHADPFEGGSLSQSEACRLLDCPARYRWERDNPSEYKKVWDFGKAAHALVLGVGSPVVVVEADDWRTKAAKEARDEAHENGWIPVLADDWRVVEAMAAAIRAHPLASRLFDPERGSAEPSLFWPDRSGITLRGRLDWLPVGVEGRRLVVPDYKTSRSAEAHAFARSVADYGYHQQAPWYLDGISVLSGAVDPAFVFVVQEKSPPYLVNVIELDEAALTIGRERNRRAIEIFTECTESGYWPGYSDQVQLASLPRWAEIRHEEEYSNGQF